MKGFKLLIIFGIIGYFLLSMSSLSMGSFAQRGPFWLAEIILYCIFFGMLWYRKKTGFNGIKLPWILAFLATIILVLISSTMYESSMFTRDEKGNVVGGMAPDPVVSLLNSLGIYIPIAAGMIFLARRYRLKLEDLYFAALGVSMCEGILFMGTVQATLFSPMFIFVPFLIAYYALAYGAIFLFPFLFLDLSVFWKNSGKEIGRIKQALYGFLMGFLAFLIYVGWAYVLSNALGMGSQSGI